MVKSDTATQRTRTAILDAAARVSGRRTDAGMAEIADAAGVGRATLYRHFPTRDSLLRAVAHTGITQLVEAFDVAHLDDLPADRAIARIIALFLREGAKYAAVIKQADRYCDPADMERTVKPVREVIDRGIREGVLRDDLRPAAVFAMFSAIVERALWMTVDDTMTPEEAAETAQQIFLNGARRTEQP